MNTQLLNKEMVPFGVDLLGYSPSVTDADVLACIVALDSGGLDDYSGGIDDYIVSSFAGLEILDAAEEVWALS